MDTDQLTEEIARLKAELTAREAQLQLARDLASNFGASRFWSRLALPEIIAIERLQEALGLPAEQRILRDRLIPYC